jgi:tetratricopeptide (TPR) repeat protein
MSLKIQHGLFKFDLTDHHAILGLPFDADTKQIRQRYLKVAQRLHPDTCKAKNDAEKKKANEILSKLVNPAYEKLSKEPSRAEHLIILSQTGKTLSLDRFKTTLTDESAQQLAQSLANAEQLYKKLLQSLANEQFSAIESILPTIARISELNLVFLALKQGQLERPVAKTAPPSGMKTTMTSGAFKKTDTETPISPVANYLRRAQEHLNKNNPAQAIAEMRDALKLEPNNSTCHGYMGLAYLKQNQVTMAKVHINKAWQSNAQDPIAIEAKQALEKLVPTEDKTKTSAGQSGNSGFFGLFGGKKK